MRIEKRLAGEKAADFVVDGMIVGLGTGSTVYYTIMKLGERIKGGLNIKCVSTSKATTELALKLGIQMTDLNEIEHIDLTIDGADEVDHKLNGIKGGGGALLYERIVASCSKENIWVVDSSKYVENLGRFPLAVEIIPLGYKHIIRKFQVEDMEPILRKKGKDLFYTDSGNVIVDLNLHKIADAHGLDTWIKSIPGVVQSGLFLGVADKVILAEGDKIRVICK